MGQAPPKTIGYGFPRLPIFVHGIIPADAAGVISTEIIPYPYYILWFTLPAPAPAQPAPPLEEPIKQPLNTKAVQSTFAYVFRVAPGGAAQWQDVLQSPHHILRHCNDTDINTDLTVEPMSCFIGPFPPNSQICLAISNNAEEEQEFGFQVVIQPAPEVTR